MSDRRNIAVLIGSSLAWREQVMRGIAGFAHEQGNWHVFTAPEGQEYDLFFTDAYRWDGLIVRPAGPAFARRVLRLGVPVVSVGSLKISPAIPRVKVDDAQNTALVLRHLLAGGLKRFAYCSFLPSLTSEDRGPSFLSQARALGYETHCFNTTVRLRAVDSWQRRQKQLIAWLKSLPKPIGILTWSPDVACQVVDACHRSGIAIPAEVAVVAADDDAMKCELAQPTITAAEIPAARIGYEAAALLQRMMAGQKPPGPVIEVPPTGVIAIRQSTAISDAADREVQQAAERMRQNVAGLSIAQLARDMQVSPRWLQRHFKRVLNTTPRQRLRSAKLETAKRLLLETDWPASRIAAKAGFHSPSHLNRVLKSAEGLTPLQFRRKHRI